MRTPPRPMPQRPDLCRNRWAVTPERSMSKKVIVHIGANQTGSSAIQKFLSLNCEALRKQGLVIPSQDFTLSSQVSGFHVFAFEELFRNPRGRQQLEAAMNVIADSQVGAKA